jgi:hypothetical protein
VPNPPPITPEKVYAHEQFGNILSGEEIEAGREFWRDLEMRLSHLGPIFHLAWQGALDLAEMLDRFDSKR